MAVAVSASVLSVQHHEWYSAVCLPLQRLREPVVVTLNLEYLDGLVGGAGG